MLSREGKIDNVYDHKPNFRELSHATERVDFFMEERTVENSSNDFDLKRRPLLDDRRVDVVLGHEICGFDTAPWADMDECLHARGVAVRIQNMRPGTYGDDRPTGCLRTESDWLTFKKRVESATGRRVRTHESALLAELVVAHHEGLLHVPVLASSRLKVSDKIAWLSSLGLGDFTRNQWDHLYKKSRREYVLKDLDLDELWAFLEHIESEGLG